MKNYLRFSYVGSFASLGVGICCILPISLMLLGVGGSWVAVFGKIAATGYYVLTVSTVLLGLAWVLAYHRGIIGRLSWRIAGSTGLTATAWVLVLYEAQINDFLITLM